MPRRPPSDWLLPLAPAALAAAHVAGLLFFLNPDLDFSAVRLLRGAGYYALLFAPLSLAAHLALARWRRVAVARLVPWSLTLVATAAALGDGVHASRYAFLLPERINAQLIKSGLWLALAAVLIFYTALLHDLDRRRYGSRSRWFVALVALGSVWVMFERRTSYRAPQTTAAAIAIASDAPLPRLLVVSLPTATLDAVLPLARQGKLPFLATMLDRGAAARLATPTPPRRSALETTWATGKLPYRHGVVGSRRWRAPLFGRQAEVALLPIAPGFASWGLAGGATRPLVAADRDALTVWEILRHGGTQVSTAGFAPWLDDGPPAAERPPSVGGDAATRELAALGSDELARELAGDLARLGAVGEHWRRAAPGSAVFVRLGGLDRAARATYGGFDSAAFEGRRSAATRRAARLYEVYLAAVDAGLERAWQALAPPRLLLVSSPYGIAAPRGAARWLRVVSAGDRELRGTLDGAPDGLLLALGDGVRGGVQVAGGRTVDLVPTVLYACGFPLARDLDGRVLAEAFEPAVLQRRALSFVPSFEGLR
ncbi:MAG: alkaline phosphatase family protein [Thermoanaerobaculia bacterium]|nr:alkaline phosphatase family protein [Thermoanaerobaculia bacterium]